MENIRKTCKLGITAGVMTLIWGCIYLLSFNEVRYTWSSTYGGDAFTGIQNATANVANNIMYLAKICKMGIAGILIAIGLMMISYFYIKLQSSYEILNEENDCNLEVNTEDNLEIEEAPIEKECD